jgi:hypothetical protein
LPGTITIAPEALRQNLRIRRVMDHLAAEFRALPAPVAGAPGAEQGGASGG